MKSSSPRSHQDVAPNKPSGLAGRAKATTIYPTATTADEDSESGISSEGEVTDDLEFSTDSKDSLVNPPTSSCMSYTNYSTMQVSILSTAAASTSATSSTPRPGVRSLPPNIQRSFSGRFTPCVIAEMGYSTSPWLKLDADTVQGHINVVYAGYEYAVEHGDGFHTSVHPHTPSKLLQNAYLI